MTTNPETPRDGRSYVRAWHALLALFVSALIVAAYVEFGIRGHAITAVALGVVVGSTLFLAGVPALVIVPWRLAQRRRGATDMPIVVGAVIFVILVVLVLSGAKIQSP